jgi:CDP-paratose 2-epimerase
LHPGNLHARRIRIASLAGSVSEFQNRSVIEGRGSPKRITLSVFMSTYSSILVTGGAGFVGSNLALRLRTKYPKATIVCADNLKRRGSELNLPRLRDAGVRFVHCDIRNPEDLRFNGADFDLLIDASAEPSVLAGLQDAPDYVINTNTLGTINCLEVARRSRADVVFLSTSRVYPIASVNAIRTTESSTRFEISSEQILAGASSRGISEDFSTDGPRSIYGATKLSSELFIEEYAHAYGLRYVINRCGVLTGPWQMGKVDQGVFALWVGMHYFRRSLQYIGWGGEGKQVRDLLSVDELADLLELQLERFADLPYRLFNVGGGRMSSLSLCETTEICRRLTGNHVPIEKIPENRPADLKVYVTDNSRISEATHWTPRKGPEATLTDIFEWIHMNEPVARQIWAG